MAKKFGKFLFFTAAVGAAAAATAYYLQKKDILNLADRFDDEDYDDFSEDLDEESETSRNYVPLNTSGKQDGETSDNSGSFTPLAEKATTVTPKKPEETVEEFFDEDDAEEDSLLDKDK